MQRLILAAAALTLASPALAHEGREHAIGWTGKPDVLVPLAVALLLYLIGRARLRSRSRRSVRLLARQSQLYLAGWAILACALLSPLHEAGEVSFTFHMIEHELIMLPAALLLVAARPGPVLLWGLPSPIRQFVAATTRVSIWRWLAGPLAATGLQAVVMIVWHMPALFNRALDSETWHAAQHLSFMISALFFWWAMLPRTPGKAAELTSAICLFATSMVGGGLGALMALGASPWYAAYVRMGMTPFGLTPGEDQQLAGLIMWIPGGLFHLCAALIFLGCALSSAPERLDDGVAGRPEAA